MTIKIIVKQSNDSYELRNDLTAAMNGIGFSLNESHADFLDEKEETILVFRKPS